MGPNIFWITNRGCAAYLILEGCELKTVENRPHRKTGKMMPQFGFEKTADINEKSGDYWEGRGQVVPKDFNEKLYELYKQTQDL